MGAGLVKEERTSATQQSPGKKEGEELCLGRTAGHCSSPDASFAPKPGDVEAGQGPWGSLCPHTHIWIPALPQSGVATDMDGLGPRVDRDALGSLSAARLPLRGWEAAVRVLDLKPATLWAPSPPTPPQSGLQIPEASPPRTQRTHPILTRLVARKRGGTTALPGLAARNSAGFRRALGSIPPDLKTEDPGRRMPLDTPGCTSRPVQSPPCRMPGPRSAAALDAMAALNPMRGQTCRTRSSREAGSQRRSRCPGAACAR